MQGSKLGPILFSIYINDLLEKLQTSNLGVTLWETKVSALGFADDIILLADTPIKLQALIDICVRWSKANGMKFNAGKNKCIVLPLNTGLKGLAFNLDGKKNRNSIDCQILRSTPIKKQTDFAVRETYSSST